MTSTAVNTPRRDADGRFVERGRRSHRATNGPAEARAARRPGDRHLAILTLAIVLGVAGFAFAVFWIGSLIVMGILWGTMAADGRRPTDDGEGLLAEVVGVVIDEAKNVTESAGPSTKSGHEQ